MQTFSHLPRKEERNKWKTNFYINWKKTESDSMTLRVIRGVTWNDPSKVHYAQIIVDSVKTKHSQTNAIESYTSFFT